MSALVTEDQLKAWSGYKQRGKLESWLRQKRIPFTHGKGNKLISTQEAVDRALAGEKATSEEKQDTFF